ncbi:sulfotransferase family cytosolic 1B member 1-like isoform X2 [Orbicella faveolata]|uniref:sulfotransferase family cytosolic 1B member 1-like isoform X2 n=1 Tax=Orbicella faveolata TaxID=48498 RepID=UPI0009E2667A|nr:sulfotransferase family cytosolic 1B member 1-like isoform X2 [Orbicella faveolata]
MVERKRLLRRDSVYISIAMSSCSFPVFQEQEGEWTSSKTFLLEGIRIHDFFTPNPAALRDYIVNFQTRGDDVFVVSYPKSGTTWLQEILWQVYNNGEKSTTKIFDRVPMLERGTSSDRIDVTALPSPRLLHTHLTYDVIPKGKAEDTKCKYIYVMRNPKDVAVSFYEFLKPKDSTSVSGFNGPWEFFARLLLEGKGESNNDAYLSI